MHKINSESFVSIALFCAGIVTTGIVNIAGTINKTQSDAKDASASIEMLNKKMVRLEERTDRILEILLQQNQQKLNK